MSASDTCMRFIQYIELDGLCVKVLMFSYPSALAYVLGAQKKRLIETLLLITHNICFE